MKKVFITEKTINPNTKYFLPQRAIAKNIKFMTPKFIIAMVCIKGQLGSKFTSIIGMANNEVKNVDIKNILFSKVFASSDVIKL